jgi:hypothetical protein
METSIDIHGMTNEVDIHTLKSIIYDVDSVKTEMHAKNILQ